MECTIFTWNYPSISYILDNGYDEIWNSKLFIGYNKRDSVTKLKRELKEKYNGIKITVVNK